MSAIKSIVVFSAAILALLALPFLLPGQLGNPLTEPTNGLPWQIERLSDGATRVFGIVPGRTSLDEARKVLGGAPVVAMILAEGESGSVEAYYDSLAIGQLGGKMVLTLLTSQAQREEMLGRARKSEYMKSATRRITLGDEDLQRTGGFIVAAIAFIPAVNLDEQIVLQRFGVPAERIRSGDDAEHFLYPASGLDLLLDQKGKELLQYVAPAEFARLRAPLGPQASTSNK